MYIFAHIVKIPWVLPNPLENNSSRRWSSAAPNSTNDIFLFKTFAKTKNPDTERGCVWRWLQQFVRPQRLFLLTSYRRLRALRSQRSLHTYQTTAAAPTIHAPHFPGPGSHGPQRAAAPAGQSLPNRVRPRRKLRTET